MVIDLVHLVELRIGEGEPVELFFAEAEVVEFVLEDDAGMEQSIGNDGMALLFLFLFEWDLLQVVLTLMRIVLCTVLNGGQGVFDSIHGGCQRVEFSI